MKKWLMLLLVICLALALSACGGDSQEPTPEPGGDEPAPVETGDLTGYFRTTFSNMPVFDPARGSDYASCALLCNIYDSLVFPTADGRVEPMLAESWDISDDGLTYTFHLRQDVKFHSGNQLTANDVKYSMDRWMTMGTGYAKLFAAYVSAVNVVDDYTVDFVLTSSYGPFLSNLIRFYVVDQATLEANYKDGDYGENKDFGSDYLLYYDAGSGPYTITETISNTSVTGAKFEGYWQELGADVPDVFVFYASNDATTVKTRMANQEQEVTDKYQTAENIDAILAADDSVALATCNTGTGLNLWFNNQLAPMDDPKVREGFGYLVDYATLCNNIFIDAFQKMSCIPSNLGGFVKTVDYSYDLEKAKACFEASGYGTAIYDQKFELVWNTETAEREQVALMIQAAANQIGIKVDIVTLPWATIVANAASVSTSPMITLCAIGPTTADAASQFVSMFSYVQDGSGTWENMNWAQDETLDGMIKDAIALSDEAARWQAYADIQQYAADNAIFIPLVESPERMVYQASYMDFDPQIGLQGYTFYLPQVNVYPEQMRVNQ